MVQHGALPAHPERSTPEPERVRWSTGAFMAWLAILVVSAAGGVFLSIDSVPPAQDWFDSRVLYLSILVLAVPSALAGWFVPRAAPYWGLVVAAPYLLGFGRMAQTSTTGADLGLVGFLILLALLAVPAVSALTAGLSRRALTR